MHLRSKERKKKITGRNPFNTFAPASSGKIRI